MFPADNQDVSNVLTLARADALQSVKIARLRKGRMLAFRLIPREERFYDDFNALARQIRHGARLLLEMLEPPRPIWDKADEIKEIEHKCDFLTHEIIQRLHRTFVTPLDREDIHTLARTLDDVMDAIDASATIVSLYHIENVRPGARELARIIFDSAEQVVGAVGALEGRKGVAECAVEINRLENEADRALQAAIRSLFAEEKDAIEIIKWKEILDFLEQATDRCEDVANVLEGVVVKHA
jgi:predicted phosphate transport protein (TIGR00153 family)